MINTFIGEKTMEFIYDKKNSYFNNFYNWYAINTDERRSFNQRPYNCDEAIDQFDKLYGHYNKKMFGFLQR